MNPATVEDCANSVFKAPSLYMQLISLSMVHILVAFYCSKCWCIFLIMYIWVKISSFKKQKPCSSSYRVETFWAFPFHFGMSIDPVLAQCKLGRSHRWDFTGLVSNITTLLGDTSHSKLLDLLVSLGESIYFSPLSSTRSSILWQFLRLHLLWGWKCLEVLTKYWSDSLQRFLSLGLPWFIYLFSSRLH